MVKCTNNELEMFEDYELFWLFVSETKDNALEECCKIVKPSKTSSCGGHK